jgi:acyl dehydratase
VRNTVERGAVRKFAQAIGDLNPLYLDEEVAAKSRWGRLIAPPTFPRVFDFGRLPDLPLPPAGIIHGDQSYTYTRPLFVGEDVHCHTHFKETYERKGSGGALRFLVFERVADDAGGERVLTSRDVLILTETVAAAVGR